MVLPVVLRGIAAVVVSCAVSVLSAGGSFKTKVVGTTVVNPATLSVAIQVTNTGSSAATPTCTINASDPSGAYSG